jgi:hypothetical protein
MQINVITRAPVATDCCSFYCRLGLLYALGYDFGQQTQNGRKKRQTRRSAASARFPGAFPRGVITPADGFSRPYENKSSLGRTYCVSSGQ